MLKTNPHVAFIHCCQFTYTFLTKIANFLCLRKVYHEGVRLTKDPISLAVSFLYNTWFRTTSPHLWQYFQIALPPP